VLSQPGLEGAEAPSRQIVGQARQLRLRRLPRQAKKGAKRPMQCERGSKAGAPWASGQVSGGRRGGCLQLHCRLGSHTHLIDLAGEERAQLVSGEVA
jgi:hypothetical protein